ncbi:MAG: hypothetical protein ABIQ40_09720 [Bacteroidia bacterium]
MAAKKSIFEFIIEVLGWIQIVASPLFTGIIIGFVVYLAKPDGTGITIAFSLAALGLIIGITWATRVWNRKGTIHFMSRVMATPELDKPKKEEE